MADPAPAPAPEDDDDGATVIKFPKQGKNRLDNDDEVLAARKRAAIAEAELKEAKAKDEKKKLEKPKPEIKKKTDHYKEETELHEARHKLKEAKGPSVLSHVPWWAWILLVLGVIFYAAGHNGVDVQADGQRAINAFMPLFWIGLGIFLLAKMAGAKGGKKGGGGGSAKPPAAH